MNRFYKLQKINTKFQIPKRQVMTYDTGPEIFNITEFLKENSPNEHVFIRFGLSTPLKIIVANINDLRQNVFL